MTCFDCKVCFGSKSTSSAEGRRFNWLIYDSMTSLFACGRFSKSRGLSASVSFLPSPSPHPSFTHSIHRPVILCSRTAQKRLLRRLTLILKLFRAQCHMMFMDSNGFGISVPFPERLPQLTQKSQEVFLTSTQAVTALQRDPERFALLLLSLRFGVTNTKGRA